jgi:hypothetical protein
VNNSIIETTPQQDRGQQYARFENPTEKTGAE